MASTISPKPSPNLLPPSTSSSPSPESSPAASPASPHQPDTENEDGLGPRLRRVVVRALLLDLEPLYPNPDRPPYYIPWAELHTFTCERYAPSTAQHVTACPPSEAEWVLGINVWRGGGAVWDCFQGWLLSHDMAPRAVVAKVCDVGELECAEEAEGDEGERSERAIDRVRAMIKHEATLFNDELASLQGIAVPLFYGCFELNSAQYGLRLWMSIWEDCGGPATRGEDMFRFALLPECDKEALRAIVADIHRHGILHGNIVPRNVLRRHLPPTSTSATFHPDKPTDADDTLDTDEATDACDIDPEAESRLCLIGFDDARRATSQSELEEEMEKLNRALDRDIWSS